MSDAEDDEYCGYESGSDDQSNEYEPSTKLAKLIQDKYYEALDQKQKDEKAKFFLLLCYDVLLEILQFGDRRRLTKLEMIGRRFHLIVDNRFGNKPFLRLNLTLHPFLRSGLKANIGGLLTSTSVVPHIDLASLPRFIHFDTVNLFYNRGLQSVNEKCELFVKQLESLKPAFHNVSLISFDARINKSDHLCFRNHSTITTHILSQLLPVFGPARGYKIAIDFVSNVKTVTTFIGKILQQLQCDMLQLEFELTLPNGIVQLQLPVDAILDWLMSEKHGERKKNGKILHIALKDVHLSFVQDDAWEIVGRLQKAFTEAESSVSPFVFKLICAESLIMHEPHVHKFSNANTGEELSFYLQKDGMEIERKLKTKKKSK